MVDLPSLSLRPVVSLVLFVVAGILSPAHSQVPSSAQTLTIDAEQEKKLLKMVDAPDSFEVQLFAAPPINYPAAITATPGGDLFVAVDRNGSLDRERGRGQIFRVIDSDGNGQADHYTVYVDSVDSPRGLVYDGETLYVMHPPDLTAYRDTNGDGTADTSTTLLRGLGRTLEFRGADHTTNGMQLGIDGWLYIAVGDYGFADAVGADGRHIRYHGGAVVRVRTDGSGLEIYSTGLRNSYDIALDSYLNGFVRGNTNDGLGWDVRLNHILPLADYGYPDLYKNFRDEAMPPLADYGGGSGTGALFVDTPDLPEPYGHTLYTVDWGLSQIFYHPLEAKGAGFEAGQERFVQIPQPTDLTIDGRSNLYVSSWFGATFTYAGPDAGFIVKLRPQNRSPVKVPPFGEASADRLLELIASPNARHRLHAQQEILRRNRESFEEGLIDLANSDEPLDVRIAALFTLTQLRGTAVHDEILELTEDPELRAFALRALADTKTENARVPLGPYVEALDDDNARVRLEAINGLVRLNAHTSAPEIVPLTNDPDRTVAEVAVNALVDLEAIDACLEAVEHGSAAEAQGALEALEYLHTTNTVTGLLNRLETVDESARRVNITIVLGRLYHREAEWNGTDWWGTQPNPRGPYFEPVTWHQSPRIRPVLRRALNQATGAQLDQLATGLERHRALPDSSTQLIVRAAASGGSLRKDLVDRLVGQLTVPEDAIDILETAAEKSPGMRESIIRLLASQEKLPPAANDLLKQAALDDQLPRGLRARAADALLRISREE